MATRVQGNQVTGLIRQTGDTLKQLEDGSWEGTVKYICRWLNAKNLAPRRNSARHPDFPVLICVSCDVVRLKPGLVAELTTVYRGFFDTTQAEDNSSEEIITNTSEAPIETHSKFVSDIGGTKASPKNGAVFDDDGKFTGWKADSKYAGVESFLTPSTIYRYSQSVKSRPTSIAGVGKLGTNAGGTPPGTDGDRNWLLSSVTWRREGGLYTKAAEYMLSGPKGWDDVIYSV